MHYNLWVLVDIQKNLFHRLGKRGVTHVAKLIQQTENVLVLYPLQKPTVDVTNARCTLLFKSAECFCSNKAIGSIYEAQHKKLTTISGTRQYSNMLMTVWGPEFL